MKKKNELYLTLLVNQLSKKRPKGIHCDGVKIIPTISPLLIDDPKEDWCAIYI